MSVILTMTSAAIIAGLTVTQLSATAIVEMVSQKKKNYSKGFETVFNDSAVLHQTLTAFDCHVEKVSENEFYVATVNGQLRYYRENSSQPFSVYFDRINNPEGLMQNISEFEKDYGRNVQDYTYHHIKNNLSENMRIYDEHMEDDELVLTINID